jgi:spore germination protein YaaH
VAAKWLTLRVPLGAPVVVVLLATALCAAGAGAATPSAGLPRARPAGTPMVLALTATHPSSAALGSLSAHLSSIGLLSPAWLALQAGGRFDYNAQDAFTAGLSERGARLVPVLADPQHLAGELLTNGPLRRRLALRLSVALRALGARGVVLDWRDLPPTARRQYPVFVQELRGELGQAAEIVVSVPPVRTLIALRKGAYDLRALARPARLLVLAWNEHGPRSAPGPVASLAFWKRTLRTVLRAAPRSRVLMGVPTWGWRWRAVAGGGAEQATQAELFPQATQVALSRPYGARVGEHAWVESDRSVQLKLLTARQAGIAGVALWVRGGESSATWRQPLVAPGPPGGSTASR